MTSSAIATVVLMPNHQCLQPVKPAGCAPHVIAAGGTGPVQLAGEPWVRRRKRCPARHTRRANTDQLGRPWRYR